MKRTTTMLSMIGALFCLSALAVAQERSLTPELVKELRTGMQEDAHVRSMRNALSTTNINAIAKDWEIIADHNAKFSHKIKTKGISNQKSSGRCWMFAGFNTIKPTILKKLNHEDFEFSHIFLQFWDKMEKSNRFLEYMIEYRDRDLMDREMVFLLKEPAPDGGYWENFADLVTKYGVIPKEAMAETASSEATHMMNRNLFRLLRKHAVELRQIHKETGSVKQMRQAKKRMLAEVYRLLVLNLGEPPSEFTWRYKIKDQEKDKDDDDEEGEDKEGEDKEECEDQEEEDAYDVEQKWSEREIYTPKSFYQKFVGMDLSGFVNLADDPIRPKGGHYMIDQTRNMWDGQEAHYANVDIQTIRSVATKVLLDNKAVYFAADVSPDQDSAKGIMARNLYDYESVYDLELDLNKAERLLFRDSTINHGMAFIGVDLRDGKPVKWLVENSWGSDRGKNGLWTMYDNWFEDNVYNVFVHKDYLPEKVRKIFDKPPVKLPGWDPMW